MTRISKSFSRPIQSYESAFLCMLDSYVICVLVLYIWKLLFPTKLLEYQSCDWYLYNFATRMSICRLPADFVSYFKERDIRLVGLEPTTPRLSSACSNQLSYSRVDVEGKDRDSCRRLRLRGVDLRTYVLLLHRKEVIQPQVPLRLPCYDFIPVTSLTLGPCLLTVGS